MWQEIKDKQQWDGLISSCQGASFLQSWQWGGFQQSVGREVKRLSWQDKIITQAIKMLLPLGKYYWYIPRGPLIIADQSDYEQAWRDLTAHFNKHKAIFIRCDPIAASGRHQNTRQISSIQPQCVRIVNITQSEEELLKQMHAKTRYNIGLAVRKGVKILPGDINDFISLNKETAKRDRFVSHADDYYLKMAECLGSDNLKIWSAEYRSRVLASTLIIYYANVVTYIHSASANHDRNIKAPVLMKWEIMRDAKARGYKYYDLGGVNPDDKNHSAYKKSWIGITRFKEGFGGTVRCHPQSFDLINSKSWYTLYRLFRSIRRVI